MVARILAAVRADRTPSSQVLLLGALSSEIIVAVTLDRSMTVIRASAQAAWARGRLVRAQAAGCSCNSMA